MATALECSSVVVDTMSWRGMVTHQVNEDGQIITLYRKIRHRLDGPALENPYRKEWWLVGRKHRVDGPAIEYASGGWIWYVDGQLHRVDGPAIQYANRRKEWWVFGVHQK